MLLSFFKHLNPQIKMSIKNVYYIQVFLVFLLFVCGLDAYSQTILKPKLNFKNAACATNRYNDFTVEFDFKGTAFKPDNVFEIQLSNAQGSFESPTVLGKIEGKNDTFFGVKGTFSFDENTFGTMYRIRIHSTNPEKVSPSSDSFEAYYTDLTKQLKLNDGNPNFVLCGRTPRKVSLNFSGAKHKFQWFKEEGGIPKLIPDETGNTLTISEEGVYYAQFEKGACSNSSTGNLHSNLIRVTSVDITTNIKGSSIVALCSDTPHTLETTLVNNKYVYSWYKNDTQITGLPNFSPTYTTKRGESFGEYYVSIEIPGGCTVKSQKVTIKKKSGLDLEVNAVGETTKVALPGENVQLAVTDNASLPSYQWYNSDELAIRGATTKTLTITKELLNKKYYLEVVDNSGSCPIVKKSPMFTVLKATSLTATVVPKDYTECTSLKTTLTTSVKAGASDGKEYPLTEEQLKRLQYQWGKGGKDIATATKNEYAVASYKENGKYTVKATVGTGATLLKTTSEEFNLVLAAEVIEVTSSSVSNALCKGGTITLSVPKKDGISYKWQKDGKELTVSDPLKLEVKETGVYTLIYEGLGCTKEIETTITPFTATAIEITPKDKVVLEEGGTAKATASGADSYEWFDENGTSVSTTEVLSVTKTGVYTLKATIKECSITKKITVTEDDGSVVIPNVLSPFDGDGVNDTWKLPNRLAFKTDVSVIIYDTSGKEILNTSDYQNDWPKDKDALKNAFFYFRVLKKDAIIKSGTISVLR